MLGFDDRTTFPYLGISCVPALAFNPQVKDVVGGLPAAMLGGIVKEQLDT